MPWYMYNGNLVDEDDTEILRLEDIDLLVRDVAIGQAIELSPSQLDSIDERYDFSLTTEPEDNPPTPVKPLYVRVRQDGVLVDTKGNPVLYEKTSTLGTVGHAAAHSQVTTLIDDLALKADLDGSGKVPAVQLPDISSLAPNPQAGPYTFSPIDSARLTITTSDDDQAKTFKIPAGRPVGTRLHLARGGASPALWALEFPVAQTLIAPNGTSIIREGGFSQAYHEGSEVWRLYGDLEPYEGDPPVLVMQDDFLDSTTAVINVRTSNPTIGTGNGLWADASAPDNTPWDLPTYNVGTAISVGGSLAQTRNGVAWHSGVSGARSYALSEQTLVSPDCEVHAQVRLVGPDAAGNQGFLVARQDLAVDTGYQAGPGARIAAPATNEDGSAHGVTVGDACLAIRIQKRVIGSETIHVQNYFALDTATRDALRLMFLGTTNTSNGSVTAVSGNVALAGHVIQNGDMIAGAGVTAGVTVTGTGSTTLTMSANGASASAGGTIYHAAQGTASNGVNTVTYTGGQRFYVGLRVASDKFPEGTTITALAGGVMTLSNPANNNGATTFYPQLPCSSYSIKFVCKATAKEIWYQGPGDTSHILGGSAVDNSIVGPGHFGIMYLRCFSSTTQGTLVLGNRIAKPQFLTISAVATSPQPLWQTTYDAPGVTVTSLSKAGWDNKPHVATTDYSQRLAIVAASTVGTGAGQRPSGKCLRVDLLPGDVAIGPGGHRAEVLGVQASPTTTPAEQWILAANTTRWIKGYFCFDSVPSITSWMTIVQFKGIDINAGSPPFALAINTTGGLTLESQNGSVGTLIPTIVVGTWYKWEVVAHLVPQSDAAGAATPLGSLQVFINDVEVYAQTLKHTQDLRGKVAGGVADPIHLKMGYYSSSNNNGTYRIYHGRTAIGTDRQSLL